MRPFTVEDEGCCVQGLGTIGSDVGERGVGLGMGVIGARRSRDEIPGVPRVYYPDDLPEAIGDARLVVVALPHTPATDGLLDAGAFAAMCDDADVVNVARVPIVDETAPIEALGTGEVAGAAPDVSEEEPLPRGSPLLDMGEIIVLPHRGSTTNRSHLDIAGPATETFEQNRSGGPP